MPVTAKLSRNFYEKLGDDVAGELVDWFNAVDAAYRSDLKETNDLNWQRFKESNDLNWERFKDYMDARIDGRMNSLRADLMRWMFIYWSGLFVGLGGLIIGMGYFGPK